MTQFLSSGLSILASLSACAATASAIIEKNNATMQLNHRRFREEYEAHRCGRGLAAAANIHTEASLLAQTDTKNSRKIKNAANYLAHRIRSSIAPDSVITSDRCLLAASRSKGALLTRYDKFHQTNQFANFGYRLFRADY